MVALETLEISPEVLNLLPKETATQLMALPIAIEEDGVTVAVAEGYDPQLPSDLAFLLGKKIIPLQTAPDKLRSTIRKHYGLSDIDDRKEHSARSTEIFSAKEHHEDLTSSTDGSADGTTIALVNHIIADAIQMHASDIHVEPYESTLRVRYRLDGVLHEVLRPPSTRSKALISRLKIMADLDIAEKRRPQDGRIRVKEGERVIDIRVSTLPTDFGEKVVLRILDKSHLQLDMTRLGFEEQHLKLFQRTVRLPYGMILVTGPTGSGKTTTLYAALNHINNPEINITTIEDPIEYNLHGINQTHVRSDIGLTFAVALRSILRQDPNVIMVGEIRDSETAEIAVRSALTGHLVFSTLHTNDAPSAITRLIDMGVEPFLVASSVKMILAQRLLRRLCDKCKAPIQFTDEQLQELCLQQDLGCISGNPDIAPAFVPGISKRNQHPNNAEASAISNRVFKDGSIPLTIFKSKGCPSCHQSGYHGRTAVYEVLPIQNGLSDMIARGATSSELRSKARGEGFLSLRDAAVVKMLRGETTFEEVTRETAL